jgi:hypothetical protein
VHLFGWGEGAAVREELPKPLKELVIFGVVVHVLEEVSDDAATLAGMGLHNLNQRLGAA